MVNLSKSFVPATFLVLLIFFISVAIFLKKTSKAIHYCLFLGSLPVMAMNSNRLPEWFTEVFHSLGKGSFFIDGPIFSKFKYFVTCPDFKQIFNELGDGILTSDSDAWKVLRRMSHVAFIASEFKDLLSNVSRTVVAEQLVPLLAHAAKTGSTIDLQEVCSRFTFDVSMNAIFGVHEKYLSTELPSNELAKATKQVQETLIYRYSMPMFLWKLMRFFNIGWERESTKAHKTIDACFYQLIFQKRENLLHGIESFDLLSSHIKAQEQVIAGIPSLTTKNYDKFLRDSMLNLFGAGNDSLASGIVWFFWLRPYVFDARDLSGLIYLHAAICESLRLYPPVPMNNKTVLKEVVLPDGNLVKPGIQILISYYSVGRMSWIWGEDCLEYKPERWIDSNGMLIRHENMSKFVPFNIGPRTCLGKDMSFKQIKAVVAAVLFNFQVEVLEGQHIYPKPGVSLLMQEGLKVKLQKRVI
ncbi:hypothetical protein MKW92_045627 [Papaver armeniacum]|nr:hypothetical protein MKW92_045627 [Papaver armeniacum]